MNNIPTDVARSKNPDAMPIGNKAGTSYGYREQQSASETAPRVGGGS
jgi:membrane carboxypeptidase/penicillin-binding protein PbpC